MPMENKKKGDQLLPVTLLYVPRTRSRHLKKVWGSRRTCGRQCEMLCVWGEEEVIASYSFFFALSPPLFFRPPTASPWILFLARQHWCNLWQSSTRQSDKNLILILCVHCLLLGWPLCNCFFLLGWQKKSLACVTRTVKIFTLLAPFFSLFFFF